MKLTEIKTKHMHYFEDERGRRQGEYKSWYDNGQQRAIIHWRDNNIHGEYKYWTSDGTLIGHTLEIDGTKVIDFFKNPELYPETPEEKTMFVLKYGNAPLIGKDE